jgi:transposase
MSLPKFNWQRKLFGLQENSQKLYAADDKYRLFASKIFPLLLAVRPQLSACYCENNGRPGIEPVILLGISLLQYLEKVPDRAAIEQLKYHLGWNIALGREIGDDLFHSTTLVRFRQRLVEQEQSKLAFDAVLSGLREAGLLREKKWQRLDSTNVLGMVAKMSQIECIRETIRLALEEIKQKVGEGNLPDWWNMMWERYVESKLDYQLSVAVLMEKQRLAGEDMLHLLNWLGGKEPIVSEGEKARLLGRVFKEYYRLKEGGEVETIPGQERVVTAVRNPHDPGAEWSAKGHGQQKKTWVGYKVQVAETVSEQALSSGEPTNNFITALETQTATSSDEAGKKQVEEAQQASQLAPPEEWYVDGAYVSAGELALAEKKGQQLWGSAQPSASAKGVEFKADAFDVNVEERKAICPAGKTSTQCSRLGEKQSGKVTFRFEWSWQCKGCELAKRCMSRGVKHRSLVVGEHHTLLQRRRQEMKTAEFKKKMHRRNGIEGTHSELVRGHGLRQARYRGIKKVRLQNYLIGAACNIKRWTNRLKWEMKPRAMVECFPGTV